jgi:hypothetical protein
VLQSVTEVEEWILGDMTERELVEMGCVLLLGITLVLTE